MEGSNIRVSWAMPSGGQSLVLSRKTGSGSYTQIYTASGSGQSTQNFLDSGQTAAGPIAANTTYTYKLDYTV